MVTRRRIRAAARTLTLARGNTTGIAVRSGAVVVPTRSPIVIVVRRYTTVATAVATTWRGGSGSKGEISRQVDGLANICVHPPVSENKHMSQQIC